MKIVVILLNIVVLIFSFYGCSFAGQTSSGLDSASSTISPSGTVTHIVEMTGDYEFVPSLLTIKNGDSVKWVVTKGAHTTTSGSVNEERKGVPDGLWDSGLMNSGSFTYTFNSAGIFPYYCTPHAEVGMIGTITVE